MSESVSESSEEPSSGSSEEPSSGSSEEPSSEEPEPSEPSFSDSYSISGSSSSGEPLDCSDYTTSVGPQGQSLYMTGRYSVDHYACDGTLQYTEIIIFTGWYCHFAGIDYWGDEPEYWEDSEEDTIWNTTSFAMEGTSCSQGYIERFLYNRDGYYNLRIGPNKRIGTYGRHELEFYQQVNEKTGHWDRDNQEWVVDEDDCYYDEEYEEWVGEGRSVVTSLPRAFVFVKPRSEQE